MRYAVIGTGAIGGYYGAKLCRAGNEVHFLFHSDYDFVRLHGLQIDSCEGSFHIDTPNAYNSTGDMPECDVVIVALKTINNRLLPGLLSPLLQRDGTRRCQTTVLLIQNGIGVEEDVQQMFPDIGIVAGLAFICSAKTKPGVVNHQFYGKISLANYSCHDEQAFQGLVASFREAGIETYEVEYAEARWKKAVWNMPFNGMTVVLNTQTDKLLASPATMRLIRSQMMEVIGAAQALGVKNIDSSFADKMIAETLSMVPYSPSMKLDYFFHRPMEIYYLYTRPIVEARKAGFPMPRLEMLESELLFLQERRRD